MIPKHILHCNYDLPSATIIRSVLCMTLLGASLMMISLLIISIKKVHSNELITVTYPKSVLTEKSSDITTTRLFIFTYPCSTILASASGAHIHMCESSVPSSSSCLFTLLRILPTISFSHPWLMFLNLCFLQLPLMKAEVRFFVYKLKSNGFVKNVVNRNKFVLRISIPQLERCTQSFRVSKS